MAARKPRVKSPVEKDKPTDYDSKWEKTLQRERALKDLGYEVESITSCEWHKDPRSQIWYEMKDTP